MSTFAPTDRPAPPTEIPTSAASGAPRLPPLGGAARDAPIALPPILPPAPPLRGVSYRAAPVVDEEAPVQASAPLRPLEDPAPLRIAGPIVGVVLVVLAALVAALAR